MTQISAAFPYIDSHTAGHPTRVVLGGIPSLQGNTVLEKRHDLEARFDHLRGALLHEPRGHAAMVGLFPVTSDVADFGAIFVSSYVYLGMCGHGTMGYARTLAFLGMISPETGDSFTLETPAGIVTVYLQWLESGALGAVSFRNIPATMGLRDFAVEVDGIGTITADILYSGMWYACIDAAALGLSLTPDEVSKNLAIGWKIKQALAEATDGMDVMRGLPAPSVLFYQDTAPAKSRHMLVLAPNKFDRSPCGTGTCARMAQQLIRGTLDAADTYTAENILGIPFTARLDRVSDENGQPAYEIVLTGKASITAQGTLYLEEGDSLSRGFLCR